MSDPLRAMAEAVLVPAGRRASPARSRGAVTVERDRWGTPRITAASPRRPLVRARLRHGGRAPLPAGAVAARRHRSPVRDLQRADLRRRRVHAHDRAQPRRRDARCEDVDRRSTTRCTRRFRAGVRAWIDAMPAKPDRVPAARSASRPSPTTPAPYGVGDRAAGVEPVEQLGGRAAARRAGRPISARDRDGPAAAGRGGRAAAWARTTGSSPAAAPRAAKPLLANDPHLLVDAARHLARAAPARARLRGARGRAPLPAGHRPRRDAAPRVGRDQRDRRCRRTCTKSS